LIVVDYEMFYNCLVAIEKKCRVGNELLKMACIPQFMEMLLLQDSWNNAKKKHTKVKKFF